MYNKDSFVERAKQVHGDKYDYSKVEYINSQTKVCIICPIHGEFWQIPAEHLRGKGCVKCGQALCGEKQKQKARETFIERCKKIHGDKYTYEKVNYVDSHTNVIDKRLFLLQRYKEILELPNLLRKKIVSKNKAV